MSTIGENEPSQSLGVRKSATCGDCSSHSPATVIKGSDDDDDDDELTVDGEDDEEYRDSDGDRHQRNTQRSKLCPDWDQLDIADLREAGKRLWERYSQQSNSFKAVRKKRANERKSLKKEKKKRKIAEAALKQADHEIRNKVQQIKDERNTHAKEIDSLEQNFLEARTAFSKLMKKDTEAALDDGKIRQSFGEITIGLEDWAKDWASATLPKDQKLLNYVKTLLTINEDNERSNGRIIEALKKRESLACRVLLLSQVSKLIFEDIFQKPFLMVNESSPDPSAEVVLEYLFIKFQRGDMQKACSWRSLTMQLWCSIMESTNDKAINECSQRSKLLKSFVNHLTVKIIQKAYSFLKRSSSVDTKRCRAELAGLVYNAANLSFKLSCQKNRIALFNRKILSEPFTMSSELFKPHSSMGFDRDDISMLGNPIDAVVVPAVVAYGSAEGDNYDEYKVWSRGIVLPYGDTTKQVEAGDYVKTPATLSVYTSSEMTGNKRTRSESLSDTQSRKRQKSNGRTDDVVSDDAATSYDEKATGAFEKPGSIDSVHQQVPLANAVCVQDSTTLVKAGHSSLPSTWIPKPGEVLSSSQLSNVLSQLEQGDSYDVRKRAREEVNNRRMAELITRATGTTQERESKQINQESHANSFVASFRTPSLSLEETRRPSGKVNYQDLTVFEREFDPSTETTWSPEKKKVQKSEESGSEAQGVPVMSPDALGPEAGQFHELQEGLTIRTNLPSDQHIPDIPQARLTGLQKKVIDLSDDELQHIKMENHDFVCDAIEEVLEKSK